MSSSFSSLACSLYRRRIVECKAAAYSSRLPSRARPPACPRIAAGANTTSARGIDSSIITIQTMKRWETLNHMAYKFGRLDKSDGKLTLKILSSIVERSGLDRITYIYCIAVPILIQAQMHSQAMSVLKHLAMTGFSCTAIFSSLLRTISRFDSTNHVVFDILVKAYVKERKVLDAVVAVFFMDDCGFKASAVACNTILNALVEEGESKHVWWFLRESLARKFPLDVTTCNILLNSLCTKGEFRKAEDMLQKMKSCHLSNSVTYNTVLHWYVKKGRFKAALCVLEDMEWNGIEADVYTYNIMIDKLCKIKRSAHTFLFTQKNEER
ncbi:hypothetical protein BS78_07G233700 [Paspalum vaginatum]|nr:hypothetical protein BS78_07G233700 [Paspalum vaginatum]